MFTYHNSFDFHVSADSLLFFRICGNGNSKKLINLPEVTSDQGVTKETKVGFVQLQRLCSFLCHARSEKAETS